MEQIEKGQHVCAGQRSHKRDAARGPTTRAELATAIFEYIEAFYNPVRRHSALDYRSPIDYERNHTTTNTAA